MTHYTQINGTDMEIKGGKTNIGGTVYEIKSGKTNINGTIQPIDFNSEITLDTYVNYNGYTQPNFELWNVYSPVAPDYTESTGNGMHYHYTVNEGTSIEVLCGFYQASVMGSSIYSIEPYLKHNNVIVKQGAQWTGTAWSDAKYEFLMTKPTIITINFYQTNYGMLYTIGAIQE